MVGRIQIYGGPDPNIWWAGPGPGPGPAPGPYQGGPVLRQGRGQDPIQSIFDRIQSKFYHKPNGVNGEAKVSLNVLERRKTTEHIKRQSFKRQSCAGWIKDTEHSFLIRLSSNSARF